MHAERTPEQNERLRRLFEAVGVKGELARSAKRMLRQTPAYAEARERGEARLWLDEEAQSFVPAGLCDCDALAWSSAFPRPHAPEVCARWHEVRELRDLFELPEYERKDRD